MSLFATNPAADKALRDLIEAGVADGSIRMGKYPPEPPRYDEALLRIHLSNMPLGDYSIRDETPTSVYFNGTAIVRVEALCNVLGHPPTIRAAEGLASALVHLLNAREQTEITNGAKP